MIFGIGTDIVRVARMAENLSRYGDRFARRILTESEFLEFQGAPRQANFLAKRFAAKEAAAKAIGTGFRDGLCLSHIGVGHDPNGRPTLVFIGHAARMIERMGIGEAHVSISDEAEYAIAFVTLLRRR